MYAESRKGKRITVFINGYRFSTGTEVIVNQHDYPILERFKSFLTERCPHPYGGRYKEIFTMNGQLVRDLEDFENGNQYVASKDKVWRQPGNNLRYTDIQPQRPIWRKGQFTKNYNEKIITPVIHQPRFKGTQSKAVQQGKDFTAYRLRVHRNNEFGSPYTPIIIKHPKPRSLMELILRIEYLLQNIKVYQIFKLTNDGGSLENFHKLTEEDVLTLQNDEHILVLDQYHKLDTKIYHKRRNFDTSSTPRTQYRSVTPPRKVPFSDAKPLPKIGSGNQSQSDAMSPYSNATSYGGRKSNKSKGSRNNRDYDTDEGGVFRAKKQNNAQGAHQVNDSRETRTEKPIDQREAEVVDEEEIHSKEKTTPIPPGTELNKRPSKETKQNSDNGSQTKSKIEERVNEDAGQQ